MRFQRPKVLVIDDDRDCLKIVTAYLQRDYFVIAAEDGLSGLEKAKNIQPHLVLCDVHMPSGWDGLTTVKKLRELPTFERVPVLMLTADCRSHVARAALKLGATGYLRKDMLNPNDLRERIAEAIHLGAVFR